MLDTVLAFVCSVPWLQHPSLHLAGPWVVLHRTDSQGPFWSGRFSLILYPEQKKCWKWCGLVRVEKEREKEKESEKKRKRGDESVEEKW